TATSRSGGTGLNHQCGISGNLVSLRIPRMRHMQMTRKENVHITLCEIIHRHPRSSNQLVVVEAAWQIERMMRHYNPGLIATRLTKPFVYSRNLVHIYS